MNERDVKRPASQRFPLLAMLAKAQYTAASLRALEAKLAAAKLAPEATDGPAD